jgi:hypothetical protein
MKEIIRKIVTEEINSVFKSKRIINEANNLAGKSIINVDIQPEYKSYVTFNINSWVDFINTNANNNRIIFLYNGADTLGMIDESSYINWLLDLGIDEDVLNNSIFYDKGYAFFRYCMDNSIDESNIADLVRYMDNKIIILRIVVILIVKCGMDIWKKLVMIKTMFVNF